MKKIIILFVLALCLESVANNRSTKENSAAKDATSYVENLVDLEYSYESETSEYEVEVLIKTLVCTATVTYNGVVQATFSVEIVDPAFTWMACQLASAQACEYIENHGGTCP